jgi:DNA-binding CsgD family transcriptional regulator
MKPHPKIRKAAGYLKLTPRETELVEMFAMGYSTSAVSKLLSISESTLRTHLRNVYSTLRIESRAELVALVLANILGITQKDMPRNRKASRAPRAPAAGPSTGRRTARKAARKKPVRRKRRSRR